MEAFFIFGVYLTGNMLPIDSKEALTSTMLQVYDAMAEAKPKLEGLIKQEPKQRRRRDYVCPTCKVSSNFLFFHGEHEESPTYGPTRRY
jgi:hypothetical protein